MLVIMYGEQIYSSDRVPFHRREKVVNEKIHNQEPNISDLNQRMTHVSLQNNKLSIRTNISDQEYKDSIKSYQNFVKRSQLNQEKL